MTVILVWGSRDDTPVARMLDTLAERGAEVCHVDEEALPTLRYDLTFGTSLEGWIEVRGRQVAIDEIRGAYVRPGEAAAGAPRAAATTLLAAVASLHDAVVINPPSAGRSNASKPYQLELIARGGFAVPDTLVTTDPSAARKFLRKHGRLVYKSLSGIRSIVATLDTSQEARLDDVRTGPVQLQEYVDGLDVRVHVVGERWFGCSVRARGADYRYAGGAELTEYDVPETVGTRLVSLCRSMDLLVAGADLRLRPDGTWVCFEVNPSPGFPWYEDATGHAIADAIADLLMNAPVPR